MEPENEKQNRAALIGVYVMIPFALAVPPIVGWFLGKWLDSLFGTDPILMYIGIVLGFVAGFREVYRIIKRFGDAP